MDELFFHPRSTLISVAFLAVFPKKSIKNYYISFWFQIKMLIWLVFPDINCYCGCSNEYGIIIFIIKKFSHIQSKSFPSNMYPLVRLICFINFYPYISLGSGEQMTNQMAVGLNSNHIRCKPHSGGQRRHILGIFWLC